MPFDGITNQISQEQELVIELLEKGYTRIENGWCQSLFYQIFPRKRLFYILPYGKLKINYCMLGAISDTISEDSDINVSAIKYLADTILETNPIPSSDSVFNSTNRSIVVVYNDYRSRTKEEVLTIYRISIQKAKDDVRCRSLSDCNREKRN